MIFDVGKQRDKTESRSVFRREQDLLLFSFFEMYISYKSGETILAKKEIAGWRRLPC